MIMPVDQKAQLLQGRRAINFARSSRGQTSLEYILLLSVVAVVVVVGLSNKSGSLLDQIQNSSKDYYSTVTRVIMDSDGSAGGRDLDTPKPIAGGWCPVTCPPTGNFGFNVIYGTCECPPPTFAGAYCSNACPSGETCQGSPPVVQCPPGGVCKGFEISCTGSSPCNCPTGEVCVPTSVNPTGCACQNGNTCDPNQICSPPAKAHVHPVVSPAVALGQPALNVILR